MERLHFDNQPLPRFKSCHLDHVAADFAAFEIPVLVRVFLICSVATPYPTKSSDFAGPYTQYIIPDIQVFIFFEEAGFGSAADEAWDK